MLRPELTGAKAAAAVELQGFHGGASDGSDSNNAHAVRTPAEVSPLVLARMKEARTFPCLGVKGGGLRLLVMVAEVAGEAEVVEVIRAALTAREDVVGGEFFTDVTLLRLAVFAAIANAVPPFRYLHCESSVRCVPNPPR